MTKAKHGCSFEVIKRGPDNKATLWLGTCTCKERFVEATYEATEDEWRKHYYAIFGIAPDPAGPNKDSRWQPEPADLIELRRMEAK
jgi:hypothetical protein